MKQIKSEAQKEFENNVNFLQQRRSEFLNNNTYLIKTNELVETLYTDNVITTKQYDEIKRYCSICSLQREYDVVRLK